MKISLNWLKNYLDIDLPVDEISELLTDIGLEVEGLEVVESIKGGLKGVVIGEVLSCEKHPNADRLSLTQVSIKGETPLQIVCGAPNVAQGQKVVVAVAGTTLYTAQGEAFTIKKGKIRGELSEGMICAEDELGLGKDHSGIIVLPDDAAVGAAASEYFNVEEDRVFEIGLTPNRADANSHIGVAKDLAAALKINHGHSGLVRLPSVSGFQVDNNDLPVEVVVENTAACPRYLGVSLKGVQVGESPDWLKNRLHAIGQRPVNNIVDVTNFVLHETGQPLHAFDADYINGHKIIVKTLPENSPFTTLDAEERKLSAEDLMICDGDSRGMCIAGVFGGINSGVTEATKNIFLESAHFDAGWIRRSSTRHGLRTDAATHFEKGVDPNGAEYALKRAILLFQEVAGGEVASEIVDVYSTVIQPAEVEVRYENINRLIGVSMGHQQVHHILEALEMEIRSPSEEGIKVAVPTNKPDVVREVDVIEEILRIYGFNKVPLPKQIRLSLATSAVVDKRKIQNTISDLLSSNGFNEIMGLSLTQSKYFKELLPVDEAELVYVQNTSNVHLDVLRPSMLFSALEAVVHNQNRQHPDSCLYEFGHTYRKADDDYLEQPQLTLVMSGQQSKESWYHEKEAAVDYYYLKAFVNKVLERLGLDSYQHTAFSSEVWSYGLRYHRGEQVLVEFGKLQQHISRQMDIRREVYYAEFNWAAVLKALARHKINFEALNKYPSVRRDLALVIEKKVNFSEIAEIARKKGKKILKDINLFDVYENEEQLGKNKKSYAVSFIFEDAAKTLKDKEVEKIMNQLIQSYEQELGAVIRK